MILDEKRLLMRKLCREFAENEFTDELLEVFSLKDSAEFFGIVFGERYLLNDLY